MSISQAVDLVDEAVLSGVEFLEAVDEATLAYLKANPETRAIEAQESIAAEYDRRCDDWRLDQ